MSDTEASPLSVPSPPSRRRFAGRALALAAGSIALSVAPAAGGDMTSAFSESVDENVEAQLETSIHKQQPRHKSLFSSSNRLKDLRRKALKHYSNGSKEIQIVPNFRRPPSFKRPKPHITRPSIVFVPEGGKLEDAVMMPMGFNLQTFRRNKEKLRQITPSVLNEVKEQMEYEAKHPDAVDEISEKRRQRLEQVMQAERLQQAMYQYGLLGQHWNAFPPLGLGMLGAVPQPPQMLAQNQFANPYGHLSEVTNSAMTHQLLTQSQLPNANGAPVAAPLLPLPPAVANAPVLGSVPGSLLPPMVAGSLLGGG